MINAILFKHEGKDFEAVFMTKDVKKKRYGNKAAMQAPERYFQGYIEERKTQTRLLKARGFIDETPLAMLETMLHNNPDILLSECYFKTEFRFQILEAVQHTTHEAYRFLVALKHTRNFQENCEFLHLTEENFKAHGLTFKGNNE